MAKRATTMKEEDNTCEGCCGHNGHDSNLGAWIVLVVALLFLLRDFGMWSFWNVSGWTIVLFLLGFWMLGKKHHCC